VADLLTPSEWLEFERWLNSSEERRQQLNRLLAGRPLPLWAPLPGPQTLAYHTQADELFYGGAAGGGKSDLLLGLAGTAHSKSLILRRESTQLQELLHRSHDLFEGVGRFNGALNTWRLPAGRMIELAGCKLEQSKQKWKGRAHDLKAFDELPDFTESQYLFITAWNRTTVQGQRCRIVGAGNPPTTSEGEWVIKRWAPWLDETHKYKAKPGELRWYAIVDAKEVEREDGRRFAWKKEVIRPKSRTFLPAFVQDNPYLMATGYVTTLQGLPEPMRSQLLFGDFTVGREDDTWQVIPTDWVKAAMNRWTPDGKRGQLSEVGVDIAHGGPAKTVLAKRYGNWFAPLEKYPGKTTDTGMKAAALIQQAIRECPQALVCIDATGVGASAFDACKELRMPHGLAVIFSGKTEARDRTGLLQFVNIRAFAYWALRDLLDPVKGQNLALPPDQELLSDLTAPRWSMTMQGIKVEPKEDIVKRLGRSPDCADAVVLSILVRPSDNDSGPRLLTLG
jgi:Terminase large subunit, T4likevirus-type, N-terminal